MRHTKNEGEYEDTFQSKDVTEEFGLKESEVWAK